MVLFELEDFEFWVENVAQSIDYNAFSPLYIYLLNWALCENKLSSDLASDTSFIDGLSQIKNNRNSFSSFVEEQLDGKMCDSYFDESVKGFICDYYEYDGYSKDLVKCFNKNLWEMPFSLERAAELNQLINLSLFNYRINSKLDPKIIDFSENK